MTEGKRGGARSGAGRKPGSKNRKTREIADKAAKDGITPLEVMIEAMRDAYKEGGAVAAFGFAKDAAPYMHAKIAAMELTGKGGGPIESVNMSKDEFQKIAARIAAEV
ncbi:MAG: hypothetical protein FWF20_12005 [Betaproteobacteria bacterium]|nr:hypothetical protein [Betaproteobacteria bacterium]